RGGPRLGLGFLALLPFPKFHWRTLDHHGARQLETLLGLPLVGVLSQASCLVCLGSFSTGGRLSRKAYPAPAPRHAPPLWPPWCRRSQFAPLPHGHRCAPHTQSRRRADPCKNPHRSRAWIPARGLRSAQTVNHIAVGRDR